MDGHVQAAGQLVNVGLNVAAEEVSEPAGDTEVAHLNEAWLPPLVAFHKVALRGGEWISTQGDRQSTTHPETTEREDRHSCETLLGQ